MMYDTVLPEPPIPSRKCGGRLLYLPNQEQISTLYNNYKEYYILKFVHTMNINFIYKIHKKNVSQKHYFPFFSKFERNIIFI